MRFQQNGTPAYTSRFARNCLTISVPVFSNRFLANFSFRPREAYTTHSMINRYICYLDIDQYMIIQSYTHTLYNQFKKKIPFYSGKLSSRRRGMERC